MRLRDRERRMVTWAMSTLLACLLALGGCGESRSRQFTAVGDTQLRLGHIPEARQAYEKALAANPNNLAARLGLARSYRVENNEDAALAAYEQARALDPTADAPYLEAVDLLMRRGRTQEARQLAAQYAEKNAERGGVLLASLESLSGETDAALKRLTGLRDQFPNSALVRISLGKLLGAAGRFSEAEQEINYVLQSIDADSLPAQMARVDLLARQGRQDEAIQELESLAKKKPDNVNLQLALARALLAANRVDEAEGVVRPVVEATPDNGWANFVLGECLFRKGQYEQAVLCLQAAQHALPDEKAVQDLLTAAMNRGERAESGAPAGQTVESAVPVTPEKKETAGWQGLWQTGRLRELLERQESLLQTDDTVREFLVCAALLLNRKDQAEALAKGLPESAPVGQFLQHLKGGKPEELFSFLEHWTEDTPLRRDLRDNAMAYGLALVGRRAAAVRLLAQALADRPEYLLPLFHSAMIFAQADMPEFHIESLKRLVSLCPENLEAQSALCDALWKMDRNEEALTQAQVLYATLPDDLEVLRILGKAYREVGDFAAAAKVLHRAAEKAPDDPYVCLQLAEMETSRGEHAQAVTWLEGRDFPETVQDAADFLRAVNYGFMKDWEKATALWQARVEAKSSVRVPLALRLACAAAYLRTAGAEAAAKCLSPPNDASTWYLERTRTARFALGLNPSDPDLPDKDWAGKLAADKDALADYLIASACVEGKIESLALPLVERLESQVGKARALNSLRMRIFARESGKADLLDRVRSYANDHGDDAAVWLGVAGIARKQNDSKTEGEALENALRLMPNSVDVWAAVADFRSRQRDYAGALAANKKLLELAPGRPEIQNNVAYSLLQTGGDVQQALTLAQSAAELLKGNASVLHTLGLAYRKAGNPQEAQRHLAAALELRPGDPTLLYDYGRTLMDLGKKMEGLQHIELALVHAKQLGIGFPEREEAENVLREARGDVSQRQKEGAR